MFLLLFDVPMTSHSKIRTCFMVFLWGKYSGEISQMQTALEAPGKSIERSHILGYFFKIWVIIGIIFSKMFGKVQYIHHSKQNSLKSTTISTGKSTFSPSRRVPTGPKPTDFPPKRRNWKVREVVAPKHQHGHREWKAWNTSQSDVDSQHRVGAFRVFQPTPGNGWLAEFACCKERQIKMTTRCTEKTIARKTVGELR